FSGARSGALFAISALLAGVLVPASAAAQTDEPVKIGYTMALTGGLGPNGRSALLAQKIWEEDVNARGGLLGRRVKLKPIRRRCLASIPSCSTSTRSTSLSAATAPTCWRRQCRSPCSERRCSSAC